MRVKIAVNGTFLVKSVTGVQRYAREMIKGLRALGFRDLLIVAPHDYPESEFCGFRVIRDPIALPWFKQWWLWEQFRLPSLLQEYPEYLLWSPSNIGPLSVSRQVVTVHDALVFAGPEWFSFPGREYYRWLIPQLAKRVLHVITDSAFSKTELMRFGVCRDESISVVPLGVDPACFHKASVDPNRKLPVEKRFVLNLGSRDPRKNIRRLISAWSKVDPRLKKDIRLGIVGGNIRGVVNEGLADRAGSDVVFFGYLSDGEIADLYNKSLFFVFPSLYEGFGLPPLEAMSCGLPVLASHTSSLPEVCGDAALYCDPLDVIDMSKKISELLSNPALRDELRKKGFDRAHNFSWKRSSAQFLDVMEAVYTKNVTSGRIDRIRKMN